jgi:hypothetical protein
MSEHEELAKWHEHRADLACNLIESFRIAGKDASLIREYEANVRFHLDAAALLRAQQAKPVVEWTQMARAMQRIGACGTEDEIESILCNAASPRATGETGNG